MKSYLYPDNELKLIEGVNYHFVVLKVVELQDMQKYFVLVDPFGLKHFIPHKPYAFYGFGPDDQIMCCVDRINCTGRVYLEPKHPVYEPGKVYDFQVIKSEIDKNRKKLILHLSDFYGNIISLDMPRQAGYDNNIKQVSCLVQRVRKGLPELKIVRIF